MSPSPLVPMATHLAIQALKLCLASL
uniref:Uncharacterized protein n=1 Tax=Anguilla anguilla TaxID=7936 RepID=A0A0E9TFE0_ANGAN